VPCRFSERALLELPWECFPCLKELPAQAMCLGLLGHSVPIEDGDQAVGCPGRILKVAGGCLGCCEGAKEAGILGHARRLHHERDVFQSFGAVTDLFIRGGRKEPGKLP